MLSDLHLSEGRLPSSGRVHRLEDFLFDDDFARLLSYYAAPAERRSGRAWRLVINGDLFDFLQITSLPAVDLVELVGKITAFAANLGVACTPLYPETEAMEYQLSLCQAAITTLPIADLRRLGLLELQLEVRILAAASGHRLSPQRKRFGLGSTYPEACWKLLQIYRGHPVVFRALAWFLAAGNELVIISGNHDLELHWAEVQAQVRWLLDFAYQELRRDGRFGPTHDPLSDWACLAIAGEHFKECQDRLNFSPWFYYEPGFVYIEHGQQYEPANALMLPLNPTLPGHGRYLWLPWGSLVVRYFYNGLEDLNPSGENLYPIGGLLAWEIKNDFLRFLGFLLISIEGLFHIAGKKLGTVVSPALYSANYSLFRLAIRAISLAWLRPDRALKQAQEIHAARREALASQLELETPRTGLPGLSPAHPEPSFTTPEQAAIDRYQQIATLCERFAQVGLVLAILGLLGGWLKSVPGFHGYTGLAWGGLATGGLAVVLRAWLLPLLAARLPRAPGRNALSKRWSWFGPLATSISLNLLEAALIIGLVEAARLLFQGNLSLPAIVQAAWLPGLLLVLGLLGRQTVNLVEALEDAAKLVRHWRGSLSNLDAALTILAIVFFGLALLEFLGLQLPGWAGDPRLGLGLATGLVLLRLVSWLAFRGMARLARWRTARQKNDLTVIEQLGCFEQIAYRKRDDFVHNALVWIAVGFSLIFNLILVFGVLGLTLQTLSALINSSGPIAAGQAISLRSILTVLIGLFGRGLANSLFRSEMEYASDYLIDAAHDVRAVLERGQAGALQPVRTIIFGHSHVPELIRLEGGSTTQWYANTGVWQGSLTSRRVTRTLGLTGYLILDREAAPDSPPLLLNWEVTRPGQIWLRQRRSMTLSERFWGNVRRLGGGIVSKLRGK